MNTNTKVICAMAVIAGIVGSVMQNKMQKSEPDAITMNLEALTAGNTESGQSGAKCPNGCSAIGWGTHKILECDCNYDHVSCCNRWGC